MLPRQRFLASAAVSVCLSPACLNSGLTRFAFPTTLQDQSQECCSTRAAVPKPWDRPTTSDELQCLLYQFPLYDRWNLRFLFGMREPTTLEPPWIHDPRRLFGFSPSAPGKSPESPTPGRSPLTRKSNSRASESRTPAPSTSHASTPQFRLS